MKQVLAVMLSCLTVIMSTGCGENPENVMNADKEKVTLQVVTTFAGSDSNAQGYRQGCQDWENETGNIVFDMSAISDDSFKERIAMDFATGSEPDVLFFFTGADASAFIDAGKVVPLKEIRKEYPEYASNHDDSKLSESLVDGEIYAVPIAGYWEMLYFNEKVLEAAGVDKPGADYTWEAFMADCEKIKNAGYTPIAAALGDIPNYWWEYMIFNHTGPDVHLTVPNSVEDELGQAWVAGMNDIKTLYDLGYFPENTTSAKDEETLSLFKSGKAAFLVDGSWRLNDIIQSCQNDPENPATLDEEKLGQFSVTYMPGTEKRKNTDIIGGVSMGYYITRKAWNDPVKREAAVNFVSFMTSDEIVSVFSRYTNNTLLVMPNQDNIEHNSLQKKVLELLEGATSLTPAVQDIFDGECRSTTFAGMPDIVTGRIEAQKAVEMGLKIYNR